MPSLSDPQGLRKLTLIAILASLAVVLGIIESLIPFAVAIPGAKLGLGNIVVVVGLVFFDGKDTLMLIVVKTLLTAFILGSFSTFLFSILGALFSFVVMFTMLRLGRGSFSLTAISVAGGICHNLGQLTAAAWVLGTTKIYAYLPFLLVTGIATGIVVGLASSYLCGSWLRNGWYRPIRDIF
ncbi:Gx transporter family protein [Paenibacillus sp. 1P07SE]|uniref:Gx transporter family protein n=1 Tax=Paenibacillus sp. 1P07SE TaxID=3132209 RepID=UPI0039A4413A